MKIMFNIKRFLDNDVDGTVSTKTVGDVNVIAGLNVIHPKDSRRLDKFIAGTGNAIQVLNINNSKLPSFFVCKTKYGIILQNPWSIYALFPIPNKGNYYYYYFLLLLTTQL
jgi:hypothetical protein